MKFGSVCSGIEAASVAWEPLGWQAQFFSEIEPFPCSVLAHHWPSVPNHGDMTKYKEWDNANIDVLVGGTPCQSFSIAGLRKGLDDPRGNLMLTFGAIAAKYQPRWLVWENVPGVLSANGGRDFGTFLGMLGQLGYGFAYRVLDAQYFGVAQRRRRVFVVGYLGDWRPAAAVLFERHSLSGNPAPSRQAREEVTGASEDGASGRGEWPARVASTLDTTFGAKYGQDNQHVNGGCPLFVPVSIHGTQDPIVSTDRAHALGRNNGGENAIFQYGPVAGSLTDRHDSSQCADKGRRVVAFQERGRADGRSIEIGGDVAYALTAPAGGGRSQERNVMDTAMRVRRLTPTECERLQGFPDGHTQVPHRGKAAADGPMYKALGNSMAVPVMRWIGDRIQSMDNVMGNANV